MRRYVILLVACAGLLVGCTGTDPGTHGHDPSQVAETERKQAERVRESFDKMREAILAGDTQTYFSYMSAGMQALSGGYEGFQMAYAAQGSNWREMFRNATVKKVAVEGGRATMLLDWSGMKPQLVEFVLENGVWHVDRPVEVGR